VTPVWQDVQSSTLRQVSYDREQRVLCVRFHGRSEVPTYYRYRNVPPPLFDALLAAQSKGKFFDEQVKRNPQRFPFDKVRDVIQQGV
jgi:hypothetical protein